MLWQSTMETEELLTQKRLSLTGARRGRDDEEEEDEERRRVASKHARRNDWQPSYAMKFGLEVIEKDPVSRDVLLAMCGLCKAFGREWKCEQGEGQQDRATKQWRRRSLTTTKFFRAFRVDNIRSHMQGAHPRRWAEYTALPKQESVRVQYLQQQVEPQIYDHLPMVDDVLLDAPPPESEEAPTQAQNLAQDAVAREAQRPADQAATQATLCKTTATGTKNTTTLGMDSMPYNGRSDGATVSSAASRSASARVAFDDEKHLAEQLALGREKLEFEKMRFKKEVELRERELAFRERQMEQTCKNKQLENAEFHRLAEVLRDAIIAALSSSRGAPAV